MWVVADDKWQISGGESGNQIAVFTFLYKVLGVFPKATESGAVK